MAYVSRGTVRATIRFEGNKSVRRVHFIPTSDYSVKHKGKQFAVFVSTESNGKSRALIKDCDYAFECAESLFNVATIAAVTHVQAEIEVEESDNKCKVIGITIPAK